MTPQHDQSSKSSQSKTEQKILTGRRMLTNETLYFRELIYEDRSEAIPISVSSGVRRQRLVGWGTWVGWRRIRTWFRTLHKCTNAQLYDYRARTCLPSKLHHNNSVQRSILWLNMQTISMCGGARGQSSVRWGTWVGWRRLRTRFSTLHKCTNLWHHQYSTAHCATLWQNKKTISASGAYEDIGW